MPLYRVYRSNKQVDFFCSKFFFFSFTKLTENKIENKILTSKTFHHFYAAVYTNFQFSISKMNWQTRKLLFKFFATMRVSKSLKLATVLRMIIYIWVRDIGIVSNLTGRHGRIVISRYFNVRPCKRVAMLGREFYDTKSVGVDKSNWIH